MDSDLSGLVLLDGCDTLQWVWRCGWLFFHFSFLSFFSNPLTHPVPRDTQNSVFLWSVHVMWQQCKFSSLTGVSVEPLKIKLLPFRLLHDEWASSLVITVFNLLWTELFTELETYLWSIIAPVLILSPLTLGWGWNDYTELYLIIR